ncbi:MAG: hypothetical protein HQL24_06390 [Candidatus Omnitrophica bacterium]|nr:hypothetical protein [Candidatus Omnitrophota bacterium]
MDDQLKQNIVGILEPLLAQCTAELIELNVIERGKDVVIQILADKISGRITVDECSWLNKELARVLEENPIAGEDFSVEVSSPGLDRPLKTEKDFLRVVGREVVFYLADFIEGKKEHSGIINKVSADEVEVSTKNGAIAIPLNKINKAVQVI